MPSATQQRSVLQTRALYVSQLAPRVELVATAVNHPLLAPSPVPIGFARSCCVLAQQRLSILLGKFEDRQHWRQHGPEKIGNVVFHVRKEQTKTR
eukprot:CAMPEP_0204502114 /NCGR_PEP_ID=MMETSP0471-20130131/100696_1 /ASSEMBLY_ACC=CAM_ASM_000602 /TAXON_ID=2969 /ORGANISM="Oxyrrhis marina" /LENGTH=94 /DNA_ID=CAMNT_0051506861 /DNA_START=278 /DNA_END=559 /DNA_ORIENTATION=-